MTPKDLVIVGGRIADSHWQIEAQRLAKERDEARAEVERWKRETETLVHQIEHRGGRDGHIYYGPDCLLCGHFGPVDEAEPCDAERRFALLKAEVERLTRERDEAVRERDDVMSVTEAYQHERNEARAEVERLRACGEKVNAIRNSIIGAQAFNWSEHWYPLVAALDAAGFRGLPYSETRANVGTLIERTTKAEAALAEISELVGPGGDDTPFGRVESALTQWHGRLEDARAEVDKLRSLLRNWLMTTCSLAVWRASKGSSVVGGDRVPFMIDLLERTEAAVKR